LEDLLHLGEVKNSSNEFVLQNKQLCYVSRRETESLQLYA